MFIPVIVGTSRKGNFTSHAAELIKEQLIKSGHETELVSPVDYLDFPVTARVGKEIESSEKLDKYKQIIEESERIVVVIPEYNRSFPGELKILFDSLYVEYKGKDIYCVGVSSGATGGARAVEAFINVIVGVEAIPHKPKFFVSNVGDVLDESGKLKEEDFIGKIDKFVESL